MAPLFTSHSVTVTGVTYYFLCKPQTYKGISAEVGVKEAPESEQNKPKYLVSELLGCGKLVRLAIYYKIGEIRRAARILCEPSKEVAFRAAAAGKPYNGGEIISVTHPRRTTFF